MPEGDHDVSAARARAARRRGLRSLYGEQGSVVSGRDTTSAGRDVIHGNVYYYYAAAGGTSPAAGALTATVLVRIAELHVRSTSDEVLEAMLREKARVVVLQGRRDSGRRHSALTALRGAPTAADTAALVKVLATGTDLVGVHALPEGRSCGYLLDASGAGWVRDADPALIAQVHERLEREESFLVVLSDEFAMLGGFSDVVRHSPPDPRAVLERHLAVAHGLEDPRELLTKAGAHPGVGRAVEKLTQPWHARVLADALAAWWTERRSDDAAEPQLYRFRAHYVLRQARSLLRETVSSDWSPRAQAFVLSGAVLDGAPLSEVVWAAHDLADRLTAAQCHDRPPDLPLFAEPLQRWLHHVDVAAAADEEELLVPEAVADTPIPRGAVARLREPALSGALLEVAWQEYDQVRGPVFRWLLALCADRSETVRVGAALAMGKLATLDFEVIREEAFDPWATSGSPAKQQALAWALESVVVDGRAAGQALGLLRRWAVGGARYGSVAVRAYGTQIGARYPGEAFEGIERALGHLGVAAHLADLAMLEIYAAGRRAEVLERLAHWHGDGGTRRLRAMATLLRLTRLADLAGSRAGMHRPDLITHVVAVPRLADHVLTLWMSALHAPSTTTDAWRCLGQWKQLTSDADVEAFVQRLLEGVRADPRLSRRLAFYDHVWTSAGKHDLTGLRVGESGTR